MKKWFFMTFIVITFFLSYSDKSTYLSEEEELPEITEIIEGEPTI